MNIGQERQIQLVGGNGRNQFGQYLRQIVGNQNRYNVVHNVGNQVVQNVVQNLGDTDEIEKVNANCILMANIHQASTSGTQTNKASIYDLDGSAEVVEMIDLSKPVTLNSVPTTKESKVVKNDKVIAPEMFRINPSEISREDKLCLSTKLEQALGQIQSLFHNLMSSLRKMLILTHLVYLL
nr:hypothetical protein [Tanacetum cinerariifolium]